MSTRTQIARNDPENACGREMFDFIIKLFPICRSITGNGLRASLRHIQELIPIAVHEVPSGSPVFDWIIPREWNIRDAYVKDSAGKRVIDFHESNLHVVNYSVPVHRRMTIEELREHLFTLPDRPDWVPYRTSYYKEDWGFCVSHRRSEELRDDEYEVCIDSSLEEGSLSYGELYLPGECANEVLISCHCCHPSICNDNLSGIAVAAFLARRLMAMPRRLSYRFLFIPGTIGSITWLALNEATIPLIRHGLVLTCLGDSGKFSYKRSRQENSEIDRAVRHVLQYSSKDFQILEFSPYGYDERQYCSPGFDLPVGRLSRTPNGAYPEYHTSADNLDFVQPNFLAESLELGIAVVNVLEKNKTYLNLNPKCEPQLGRRGLYRAMGGLPNPGNAEVAMLWILNLSDGAHTLLDIADRASLPFDQVRSSADTLEAHGLLREVAEPRRMPKGV